MSVKMPKIGHLRDESWFWICIQITIYACSKILNEYTVKTDLVKIRIIYLYKEGHHTVRNKGDLDSGIKTKTSNLAI